MSKVIVGINDLQTVNPTLAEEWDYEKNIDLKPTDVAAGSKKRIWWVCKNGHSFQAGVVYRNSGNGCPICANQAVLIGYNDLQTTEPELAKEWNYERNDNLKPTDLTKGSNKIVWWKCKEGHEWEASVNNRSKGRGCPFCSNKKVLIGFNDLATKNPELSKEWNYEKNGNLQPTDLTDGSNKKVWWKCDKGHEWEAYINNRKKGYGCPFCSNKKVLIGFNDLLTVNPELAKEWNYNKNGELKPTDITEKSNVIVWWRCKNGHEWEANANNRSKGKGCPYCSGRYAIESVNDLATLNPELTKEWDYKRNGDLKPSDVKTGTSKKVWWIGNCGHEWEATINSRNNGNGCPYCSNKKVLLGYNDLQTVSPELTKEWDYEKNTTLKPCDIMYGSQRKVWWVCKKGHSYLANVANRMQGQGCPICSSHMLLKGFNDLVTTNPDIAKEWNYDKNDGLIPSDVMAGTEKKVWWICSKGHEWKSYIYSRTGKDKVGCPYCSNRKILKGYNDLETVYPDIAKEWNYDKNGDIKTTDVFPVSGKKYWWICSKGHEWKVSPAVRTSKRGTWCPICSESHLEKFTREVLDNLNIDYKSQVRFEKLTGMGEQPLSYDYGLYKNDSLIALIECQGIQHYKPVELFGGKSQFEKQKMHDELKREYAKDYLKVPLLEIPYTEEKAGDIQKMIINFINNCL